MADVNWDPPDAAEADAAVLSGALAAAKGGEVAAFNVLVRAHQRQVYNVCYRVVGHAEDAADAAQEAFTHAFRAVGGFEGSIEAFRGWLLRIAVNACYDGLRRRKRRPSESLDAMEEASREEGRGSGGAGLVDRRAGPEEEALSSETAQHIQRCLGEVSDEQRATVVLCDVQGLSYEEAAVATGVELGTIKSRLSRARAALRDCLRRNGELPGPQRRLES